MQALSRWPTGVPHPSILRVRVLILLFSCLPHHSLLSVFSRESMRINPFSPFA